MSDQSTETDNMAELLGRLAEAGEPVPCDPDGVPVPPEWLAAVVAAVESPWALAWKSARDALDDVAERLDGHSWSELSCVLYEPPDRLVEPRLASVSQYRDDQGNWRQK